MSKSKNCHGSGPNAGFRSPETINSQFACLLTERLFARDDLKAIVAESEATGRSVAELLMTKGIAKHEVLRCLSAYYGLPYLEYDEGLLASSEVLSLVDLEELKQSLWFPLLIHGERARVIICNPSDLPLCENIQKTLRVASLQVII